MLAKLLQWLKPAFKRKQEPYVSVGIVLARSQHKLSRKLISSQALKVLYRLHDAGYQAYLVGGGVRDVLLGYHPKDFDVATNARPEEVYALFRNSRMIGRRFRLVHVHFGAHIVEVATFRSSPSDSELESNDSNLAKKAASGMILRDNIYGSTLEEDVWRRDFTVNAIYYNIKDYSLIDYVGGLKDLETKTLRLIGDPEQRYREDPLRMLRCVRFAAKLKFHIDKETEAPIYTLGGLIKNVPSARVFDEYLKLFLSGFAFDSFHLLRNVGLFKILFPETDEVLRQNNKLNEPEQAWIEPFIELALKNTDQRVHEHKSVTPYFLLAVLLWPAVSVTLTLLRKQNKSAFAAIHEASDLVLHQQLNAFSIPRKMSHFLKEIWMLQFRLEKRHKNRVHSLYLHPRFRAAFDFLRLRKEAGDVQAMASSVWWENYNNADEPTQNKMFNELTEKKTRHKRHKKRRGFQPET